MIEKFLSPLPFFREIKYIIHFYFHVFRYIFWLVLILALLQAFVPALAPLQPTVGLAIAVLSILAFTFFHGWALYRGDTILMGRDETMREAFHVVKKRFINMVIALFIYAILSLVFTFMVIALLRLGKLMGLDLAFFIIAIIFLLYVGVLLTFALPAIILDGASVIRGFETSARLVWRHWWRAFGIMVVFAIPIVLLSLGQILIAESNIIWTIIYEFIYHIITYPLYVSLLLVIYHDLKFRHHAESFKQITHPQ